MKCHCKRCGHKWQTRFAWAPRVCPICKRPDWKKPKEVKATLPTVEELVQRRKKAGITLIQMAERMGGISFGYLSMIENGKRPATENFFTTYAQLPK